MAKTIETVGIVGCGAIARSCCAPPPTGAWPVPVAGVTSRSEASARTFLNTLKHPSPYLSLSELVDASDLVIETAGRHVVRELATRAFAAGKSIMVISVGALIEHAEFLDEARRCGCACSSRPGLLPGWTGSRRRAWAVDFVRLTSRKPPRALEGSPFLAAHGISLAGRDERELFRGPPARR